MFLNRFLILFLSVAYSVLGMSQGINLSGLNYRHLTAEQGLPSNHVTCFKRDSRGFMWVGTRNGLARWDGSMVKVFKHNPQDSSSISGNFIKDIVMEGDSVMWVATAKDGLNKYNFKTQVFTRYFPNPKVIGTLPNEEVIGLAIDDFGNLWIGFHRAGFCKYNRKTDTFEVIDLPEFETTYRARSNSIIKKFLFDAKNPHVVWLFTIEDLLKYNDETKEFNVYPYINQDGEKVKSGVGYGIQALDGKLYIPTYRKGVTVFDPELEKWENYDERDYDPLNVTHNQFSKIEQIDKYTFWVGSPARGMALLDIRKGYIERLNVCPEGVTGNNCTVSVTCMDMDADDGHWMGTTNGLRFYPKNGNQFDVYPHHVSIDNLKGRQTISAICQMEENGIYYGGYAGEGVYYFDFKTKIETLINPPKKFRPGEGFEMFYLIDFSPYNDSTVLVLSSNALFKLHSTTNTMEEVNTGLQYNKDYIIYHKILRHSSGNYYISTRHNGIFILDSELRVIGHLIKDENKKYGIAASNYIYEIAEDANGNVWIGREDGFSMYNPVTGFFVNSDYKERLDSTTQLKVVFKIKQAPDSSLWFMDARSYGLCLDYPYSKPYVFTPIYTGKDSLSERVLNFNFLRNGSTIISSTGGLTIIDSKGNYSRYNRKQGLPGMTRLRPVFELQDGSVAMGFRSLIFFHPDSLKSPPDKLPVYLSSIRVFNEELDFNYLNILNTGLELSYLENFFEVSIGLINFNDPGNYTLSYRLKGLHNEWITSSNKKAIFTYIPGGKYVFEARFLDQNQKVLAQGISFPVTIIPPFWKTGWFISSVGALFIIIGIGFYRMKIASIKRENVLKTEFNKQLANMELSSLRAQMNPHFLFNSLNSIRHKIMSNKPEEADVYLVKFSRLVRRVLQNSKEDLINLCHEIDTLKLYMALESGRFEDKFEYEVIVSDTICLEDLKIPPLIIQPYVENAIWHGLMQKEGKGKVTIKVDKQNKNVQIVVEDNGVGREKAKELKSKSAVASQSMGIGITGNRLEIIENIYQIQCKAEITDLKNNNGEALGTRVTLLIPLIYES